MIQWLIIPRRTLYPSHLSAEQQNIAKYIMQYNTMQFDIMYPVDGKYLFSNQPVKIKKYNQSSIIMQLNISQT